jgi:hypothetical protein
MNEDKIRLRSEPVKAQAEVLASYTGFTLLRSVDTNILHLAANREFVQAALCLFGSPQFNLELLRQFSEESSPPADTRLKFVAKMLGVLHKIAAVSASEVRIHIIRTVVACGIAIFGFALLWSALKRWWVSRRSC